MTILVTGRFSSPQGAEQALSRLIESGFLAADTDSFPIDTTSADPLSAAANDATDARVDQTIGSESIAGANGPTLSLPRVQTADLGEYDVVVSNAAGS